MNRTIICVECPQGCLLRARTGVSGALSVAGAKCPRGAKYARREIENPVRVFTSCVICNGLELKMLPVRTAGPIARSKIFAAMEEVKKIKVTAPLKTGDAVVKNFLGSKVDLTASRDTGRRL